MESEKITVVYLAQCFQLLSLCLLLASAEKCDHTPESATNPEPTPNTFFRMTVQNQGVDPNGLFMSEQRYVITLYSTDEMRMFSGFMITVEDPDVDRSDYEFVKNHPDVGFLKTLDNDLRTTYSERCPNTVKNIDNSDKKEIQVHWLSPKATATQTRTAKKVRIRSMIAENSEIWYIAPNLTVELGRDDTQPIDTPPIKPQKLCNQCSEARYEVTFQGQWSQLTHPQHFPIKSDDNAYTYMVGASHDYGFTLWHPNTKASPGLKKVAEEGDTTDLEDEIIVAISRTGKNSTRTLIRGPRHANREMFQPSHALFRVDPLHHLFSVVIGIRPSPDWFLGAFKFDLCSNEGWLESHSLSLFPWDAGTMDGVSYDSPTKMTQPEGLVDRVALGSFDINSPFYQINLNDLKPFGFLNINRLNVYQLEETDCDIPAVEEDTNTEEGDEEDEEAANQEEEPEEEPEVSEVRQGCGYGPWGPWYPCKPDDECGPGKQTRVRIGLSWNPNYQYDMNSPSLNEEEMCVTDPNKIETESKDCFVDCEDY